MQSPVPYAVIPLGLQALYFHHQDTRLAGVSVHLLAEFFQLAGGQFAS